MDQLINWFFTAGSDIEEMIEPEYQEMYEKFILQLLNRPNAKISTVLEDLVFDN